MLKLTYYTQYLLWDALFLKIDNPNATIACVSATSFNAQYLSSMFVCLVSFIFPIPVNSVSNAIKSACEMANFIANESVARLCLSTVVNVGRWIMKKNERATRC